MKHLTIAIDGPGGAGKSTVAGNVARRLNILHLDTGAMYRAFAYQALAESRDPADPAAMEELASRIQVDVTFENGMQHTFVNGQDVTARIRTQDIGMAASGCAIHHPVRSLMVRLQQELAARQPMVLDGRDIGTRVLPDATLKVFLTASPEVRAQRRVDELAARGETADYREVLAAVIARDHQDSTRAVDPLTAAPDAVLLDTSHMTCKQAEDAILAMLEDKGMQPAVHTPATKPCEKYTLFYRLAMWLSIFLFHTVLPVRYHNAERAEIDAPFILIGNHNSMLDPLLIGWKVKRYQLRYLGKKELTKNPLMRAMYRNMQMIPVDRHNMDMHAIRACLAALKEKHALAIFPEGTRHKKTLMEEMESGVAMIALRSGAPILPAYITGKPRWFRPIDCYYGEPFSVAEIAAGGINREACDEVMRRIAALYRDMAAEHTAQKA